MGVHYTIFITRKPPKNPIRSFKAPTLTGFRVRGSVFGAGFWGLASRAFYHNPNPKMIPLGNLEGSISYHNPKLVAFKGARGFYQGSTKPRSSIRSR